MKQTTKIAVAGLLSAAGAALQALANEISGATPQTGGTEVTTQAEVTAPAEAPKPKRAKAEKPAAAAPEPTPTSEHEAQPDPVVEVPTEDGETAEEKEARYQKNRDLIMPLVKGVKKEGSETEYAVMPQGEKVKSIIKKHSPTEKLPDLPLDKQSAFEKDLEALTY